MKYALLLLFPIIGLLAFYLYPKEYVPPQPPTIPTDLVDQPIIDLLQSKRAQIEANPNSAKAWGQYGMAFHAHSKMDEAKICYEVATQLAKNDSRWVYLLGYSHLKADAEKAVPFLEMALDREPEKNERRLIFQLRLADAYLETKNLKEAEKLYLQVLQLDSKNDWALFRLSALAVDKGEDGDAIKPLMRFPRNPVFQKKAAALLAGIHRRRGNTKEAEGFEYAAAQLPPDRDPTDPLLVEVATYARGRQSLIRQILECEQAQDFISAIEISERVYRQYPDPANQLFIGKNMVCANQDVKALPILKEIIQKDPSLVIAHAFLGVAHFKIAQALDVESKISEAEKEYNNALQAFDRAIELKSDYATGYFYRAQALSRLDRDQEAIDFIRQFLLQRPEQWEGYLTLADILQKIKQPVEAEKAIQTAMKLANPSDPRPKQALAKLKKSPQ